MTKQLCTNRNTQGKQCKQTFWTRSADRKTCHKHGGFVKQAKRQPRIAKRVKSMNDAAATVKKGKKK